jgi:hypothetical protein
MDAQLGIMATQLKEIQSGAKDTHDLAVAARDQANASKAQSEQAEAQTDKMAESITKTDNLIGATNKLAAQAGRQADAAHEAITAAAQLAQQDRRPWVGLRDFRCDGCSSETSTSPTITPGSRPSREETITIGNMFGIMENSGKTPAVQMIVNAIWTDGKAGDPIPDYDSIEQKLRSRMESTYRIPSNVPPEFAAEITKTMEIAKRKSSPTPTVLPPSAIRPLPIVGNLKTGRNIVAPLPERRVFYIVGKISYYATERKTEYVTTFCLMNESGAEFHFCPSGNDMK